MKQKKKSRDQFGAVNFRIVFWPINYRHSFQIHILSRRAFQKRNTIQSLNVTVYNYLYESSLPIKPIPCVRFSVCVCAEWRTCHLNFAFTFRWHWNRSGKNEKWMSDVKRSDALAPNSKQSKNQTEHITPCCGSFLSCANRGTHFSLFIHLLCYSPI